MARWRLERGSRSGKLGPLSELLKIHREELNSYEKRITEAEQRNSALEDTTDDLENRGRRKNTCIVGLPEEAEEEAPTQFFET